MGTIEINSQLNKLREFLQVNVCDKIKLKAETKVSEYENVNPKCFIFAPRDIQNDNINYPFISIEFDEIIENRQEEIYSIQLYVFVFDNGVNYLNKDGTRSYYPNKGQGFVTLFNFLSKIRREILINSEFGKLIDSEISIKLLEVSPPYFGAVISFKMKGLHYPIDSSGIKEFLNL